MRDPLAHLHDDAEAYALGLLPPGDRESIEAHLATCASCRAQVVAAERVVWQLGIAQAPPERKRLPSARGSLLAAIAAAVVFAFAGGAEAVKVREQAREIAATDAALVTIAHSHFLHASLQPLDGALTAKVLYARDGSWIYCIVDGAGAYDVAIETRAGRVRVGMTTAHGSLSDLYAAGLARPDAVVVSRDGRDVARAALSYGP